MPGWLRSEAARHYAPRFARTGPPESERPGREFQYGLSGDPRKRGGEWREPPAWKGEPATVCAALSALAGGRSPGRTRDQWCPYADAGIRRQPTIFGRRPVAKIVGWGQQRPWSRTFAASPTPRLWQFRTAARTALVEYARERLSKQLAASGASPEAVDGAKHLFDPNHVDAGLCTPFCHLQKTEPAAARPGAIAAPVDQSSAPDATHHRRQGTSGGPGRSSPNPGMDRNSSGGPRPAPM